MLDTDSTTAVSVNQNYLDKVMDLAQVMDVEATEDIFDARGVKLVAKGAKISPALQEKLIMHKLKKPLEACLAVEGGVTVEGIVAEARRIAETNTPVLQVLCLVGGKGPSPFDILGGLRLGNAMSMMLTITERGGSAALTHAIAVSLISFSLASKCGVSRDVVEGVMLAGLLHDIGELYIAPEFLQTARRLRPHEWRHIVVHPKISQMLIADLGGFPPLVAQAVADHHERLNGTGYPRQLSGKEFAMPGQILSVAEMISGIFLNQPRPLECAELALKVVPGEHAPALVSAISGALRGKGEDSDGPAGGGQSANAIAGAKSLAGHIATVQHAGKDLLDGGQIRSKAGVALLRQAVERVAAIERAFVRTGIDPRLLNDRSIPCNLGLIFEASVVTREISWRLRDVARDLSFNTTTLEAAETAAVEKLIDVIDAEPQAIPR